MYIAFLTPLQIYEQQIVEACAGMPLALELTGQQMKGKLYDIEEWKVSTCTIAFAY